MVLQAKKIGRNHRGKEEALREVVKEETTAFNMQMPVPLYNRLKLRAAKEGKGRDMTKIVIESLGLYFEKVGETEGV